MDVYVILVSAIFATVKCDVGLGYQYRPPATSYEVPFRSVGNLDQNRQYYHVDKYPDFRSDNPLPTSPTLLPIHGQGSFEGGQRLLPTTPYPIHREQVNNLLPSSPASLLQTPIHEHTAFKDYSGLIDLRSKTEGEAVHAPVSQLINQRSQIGGTSSINYSENLVNVGSSHNVETQKHLYFYSAPDEPEVIQSRVITPPASAKNNVKILFIKAPTFKFAPVQIPSQIQNQEKTLVYVLVKKPDEPEHIVVPTPEAAKPAKPEVYFIKYQTQQEAEDAVSNIQQGGGSSSATGAISDNEAAFHANSDINNNLLSRISPIPGGALPSTGDFSNLNINSQYVYNAPTTQTSLNGQVQGIESSTVNSINLPTSTSSGEVRIHEVYGPPKTR